ncbi:hypothetical protein M153_13457000288 [Pseudoloma neurophilia]|uniref:Uncharacterized protein n=1 Tax=Pseudoloma neurophilia TaxID=146866 RepID=A0A0R0LRT3_9MICR|nr:hypothetical protein M153_13457000288 [Pseudoloma neurophilia]
MTYHWLAVFLYLFIVKALKHKQKELNGNVHTFTNGNYGIKVAEQASSFVSSNSLIKTVNDTSTGYEIKLEGRRENLEISHDGNSIIVSAKKASNDPFYEQKNQIVITVTHNSIASFSADEITENGRYKTVLKIEFENPNDTATIKQTEIASGQETHRFTG